MTNDEARMTNQCPDLSADSRAISAFVSFEFLWNLGCGMFSLSVVSAFIVAMGGSLAIAGMVSMLGGLVSLLAQPLSMLLFGQLRDRRFASVGMLHCMTLCFLGLGVMIYALPEAALRAHAVYIALAMSAAGMLFGSLNAPLYYSLAIDSVSPRQLGRMTGLRQAGNAAGNLAAAALVGWLLASTVQPFNYGRALVVGGILGLLGSASLLWLPKQAHLLRHGEPRSPFHHFEETLRQLGRERRFWLLMGGLWLAAMVGGTMGLGLAYLRRAAGSDSVVGVVIIVSAVARLISGPPCGWMVTRFGMRSAAYVSLAASLAGFIALIALPPMAAAVAWGVITGITLATMEMWTYMLPAGLFPHVNRVGLVAVLGTLMGPVMFAAPILLGRLLDAGLPPGSVFLPAAVVALVAMIYFWLLTPRSTAAPVTVERDRSEA